MKVLWTFALVKRITVTAVVVCFYSFVLATSCQSVLEKGVSSGSIAVFVFLSVLFLPAAVAGIQSTVEHWRSR